ncbi:hypothetical protein RRSWK_05153 [Rhodopirellula sp. SWK7]|nr:hypothetical protein RRSWK_05153 [Rhodopirellula sp. SWK7]
MGCRVREKSVGSRWPSDLPLADYLEYSPIFRKMNHLTLAICIWFASAPYLNGEEYRIDLQSNGIELDVVELDIKDGIATATVGDTTERFDLKQNRWWNEASGQWVTLSQCKTWAAQSNKRTKASSASIPPHVRSFVLWSLNPMYESKATGTLLTLTSGQFDYHIMGEKSNRDLSNYFGYAKLNAYKKAMTERKLPPFAELKAIEAMERSGILPRLITVEIPGIPDAPTIKMRMSDR